MLTESVLNSCNIDHFKSIVQLHLLSMLASLPYFNFLIVAGHYDRTDSTDPDGSVVYNSSFEASIENHRGDTFIIYRRRWWILLMFSLLSFMQGGLPNVWTVIAESAEAAFGWTDSQISLMQAWIYGCYLISVFPFAWLIDTKGRNLCRPTLLQNHCHVAVTL